MSAAGLLRINNDGSYDNTFDNGPYALIENLAGGAGNINEAVSVMTDTQNRILFCGGAGNDSAYPDPEDRDMIIARGIDGCSVFNTPTYTPTRKPSFTIIPTISKIYPKRQQRPQAGQPVRQ